MQVQINLVNQDDAGRGRRRFGSQLRIQCRASHGDVGCHGQHVAVAIAEIGERHGVAIKFKDKLIETDIEVDIRAAGDTGANGAATGLQYVNLCFLLHRRQFAGLEPFDKTFLIVSRIETVEIALKASVWFERSDGRL
jgi:hypothetical protein